MKAKAIAVVSGVGLVALVVAINLLYATDDGAWVILAAFGALVLLVGLVMTIAINVARRGRERPVRYGRHDGGGPS